ncbi:uncharacterized protein DUF1203 [Pseudoduganella lurida]|uniref:Uncharacterized protein DUF1203 n=1 Tax=Pseudoduganella lurida TaxID=1036180 RepID=A0A562RJN1_9BURK|nr:DUF1203 domain-containing protein [Pseudoduganella lurida]TWI69272.1 uncharacterized protein DUF1203 [Pseudoduganella lurida]
MHFRLSGLSPHQFESFFGMSDAALAQLGVRRQVVDRSPGFPDRVTLQDVAVGQTVLLLNYVHQPAATPYRASHAIFVQEGAARRFEAIDEVPESLRIRLLSVRAYDTEGMLRDGDVVDGRHIESVITRMFQDAGIAYLHVHHARHGCYACRVDRV